MGWGGVSGAGVCGKGEGRGFGCEVRHEGRVVKSERGACLLVRALVCAYLVDCPPKPGGMRFGDALFGDRPLFGEFLCMAFRYCFCSCRADGGCSIFAPGASHPQSVAIAATKSSSSAFLPRGRVGMGDSHVGMKD